MKQFINIHGFGVLDSIYDHGYDHHHIEFRLIVPNPKLKMALMVLVFLIKLPNWVVVIFPKILMKQNPIPK